MSQRKAKTSVRTVAVPSGRIYVNFTALSQEEIGKLQKIHVFKTEVVNQTTNYNRTYYINYRQVEVAGSVVYKSGQNLIGLVVFSIAVGLVTAMLGEDGKPLLKVVDAMNKVVSKLVQYVMWYVFILPISFHTSYIFSILISFHMHTSLARVLR